MRIVLNADDFGASPDTVQATIECFEQGALTSATIMASMPASADAVAFARSRPELGFGVHLTLVRDEESRPISPPETISRLLGEDGLFLPTQRFRALALLRRLPRPELERELEAQVAFVRDHGVSVTHVDSHRHVHKLPFVQEALAQVLPRFGIERVRTVQDVYLRRPLASPTVWLGPRWRRGLERRFRPTAHFYMPTTTGDSAWHEPLLERLARLRGATLEVGVHPGHGDPRRDGERRSVLAFAEAARARGHELVSWPSI